AQLSGGERQRVCLARALANYPALLLADEPTGNLSPSESREIMGLFELIHRQGITVVAATHDRENAAGLSYREIALKKKGERYGKDGGPETSGQ
ncbi:MAG: ATP-binding cassette domain-containing protein, partial [Lachnospiraceae bacterium]|nr:ATP-binding cassette domain-containing protein [Lachnospiraceae bacterium]